MRIFTHICPDILRIINIFTARVRSTMGGYVFTGVYLLTRGMVPHPGQGGYPPAKVGAPPAKVGYPPGKGRYPMAKVGSPSPANVGIQHQGRYPPGQDWYPLAKVGTPQPR